MDRKSDPVTPLLMQWLYMGMVHEFMPIWNNRVKLVTGGKEEEFVLALLLQDETRLSSLYCLSIYYHS